MITHIHVFLGENCDIQLISSRVQDPELQKEGSTYIFGMILVIMVVCGFAVFLMYHKKKVTTLKRVIAQVSYVADPSIAGEFII